MKDWDVVVIGGGASGMMAACTAAERGRRVLLLEKNKKLGMKLAISGGGRCNITNAEDAQLFLTKYGNASKFLHAPFAQFGTKDTFEYFESRDLPLVVQARTRVFPKTERAQDVVAVFERELKRLKVTVRTGHAVTNMFDIPASSYILATGGVSHPETGSTGDGFKLLRALGHTIKDPTPTIVPIAVSDAWIKMLAGTSISPVKVTVYLDGARQFSKTGKILCTHFGLSGPMILNMAAQVGALLESGGTVTATIDCDPEHDLGTAEKKVIKIFDENKNKSLRTVLKMICPAGTARGIQTLLETDLDTKVHSVSREDRKKLVHLIKALPVSITGLMGFDRAVVADGGVPLAEIDTKTMRSLKDDRVYVTGDLLHINRPSGGYSLQLCWTTGFVAGMHA